MGAPCRPSTSVSPTRPEAHHPIEAATTASTGWTMRRSVRKCASPDSPPPVPVLGNNVSARAVTAPVAASRTIATPPSNTHRHTSGCDLVDSRRPPDNQKAVIDNAAKRKRVFTRCNGTATTRANDVSSATHSARTIIAPIRASPTIAAKDSTAPVRAGSPDGTRRQTHTTRIATRTKAAPLAARCVNSMAVAPDNSGMTTP